MRERLEAIVYGHVHGVSFRYYTMRKAKYLGLTGWVANRIDGTVYLIAEGEQQKIQSFIEFLRRGSPMAQVKNLKLSHLPPTNEFKDFSIRYL